jgi:hypothetical protein
LPKIWGNIALAAAAVGCGPEPPVLLDRTIRVYSLPGCPAPESASLELEALGAFPATNLTAELLPIDGAGRELRFPQGTRAIAARVQGGERSFVGYGEAPASGDVALSLWPLAEACTLFDSAELAGFPSGGGGQALGFSPSRGLLLAAGGNDPKSSAVVGALTFDTRRGAAYAVDAAARHVLAEPRAFATVTEFGSGLLVAGGENPIHDVDEATRLLRSTAEIYDPDALRFEADPVTLVEPRTRHAALVLPSGETLLIGGRGAFGTALSTLEAVSPVTRSSSLGLLTPLTFGRIEPSVLRLTDGRLFVAGGYDAAGLPVAALEWLEPDGSRALAVDETPVLPPRFDRAYSPLPGGALLAVGGCEPREPVSSDEAASCAAACRRGCPPAEPEAWWIAPDGSAEPVELDMAVSRPLLVPGGDGSPWLFAGSKVRRFNPFRARFEEARFVPAELPPPLLAAPVAAGPDHFFWLSDDVSPRLVGLRAGTRERFARDVGLVASTQSFDPLWPVHLAPDRHPAGKLSFDGALRFEGPLISVFVTDALYDDLELTLEVDGSPPALVLGDVTVGDDSCPWPSATVGRETLRARRTGEGVELERQTSVNVCLAGAGPRALGLRSNGQATRVLGLEVSRR